MGRGIDGLETGAGCASAPLLPSTSSSLAAPSGSSDPPTPPSGTLSSPLLALLGLPFSHPGLTICGGVLGPVPVEDDCDGSAECSPLGAYPAPGGSIRDAPGEDDELARRGECPSSEMPGAGGDGDVWGGDGRTRRGGGSEYCRWGDGGRSGWWLA